MQRLKLKGYKMNEIDNINKIKKVLKTYDNDGININIDDLINDFNEAYNTKTFNDLNNITLTK